MSCQQNSVEPDFPPTKAYYSFRVFRPTDPGQPRNEVGFDTLTYRAEDGSTRILTNRTLYFTNQYDTTIYANVPADRVLEGYLSSSKAMSVVIEVGLIDKTGAKRRQDYQSTEAVSQSQTTPAPVRLRIRKEVPLAEISAVN